MTLKSGILWEPHSQVFQPATNQIVQVRGEVQRRASTVDDPVHEVTVGQWYLFASKLKLM
jgi:hypothetical protein